MESTMTPSTKDRMPADSQTKETTKAAERQNAPPRRSKEQIFSDILNATKGRQITTDTVQ